MAAGSQDVGAARPAGRREAEGRGGDHRAPKAGSGSRSRPTSPMATPTACAQLRGDAGRSDRRGAATRDALRPSTTSSKPNMPEADELPDEVDERLGEIETALDAFEDRPVAYDPAEIARAGVFVSIDADGALSVDRGYVRPEDEAPVVEPEQDGDDDRAARPRQPMPTRRHPARRHHRRRRAAEPARTRKTMRSSRCPTGWSPS